MKGAKPFYNPTPGEIIVKRLEENDWKQEDLAYISGFSKKHINEVIKKKKPISLDLAIALGDAFDTSPTFWINLDTKYRLEEQKKELETERKKEAIKIKAEISKYMPISELFRKGWLSKTKEADDLRNQVLNFWKIDELKFLATKLETPLTIHFSKSDAFKEKFSNYAAQTWLRKAKSIAEQKEAPNFNRSSLETLYSEMPKYTVKEEGISEYLENLNQVGVKFFVLSHLQKTYLDGAAFVQDGSPVVVCTTRFDRLNNFWFTLAHEIAHVLLHLNLKDEDSYFLDNTKEANDSEEKTEKEANNLAAEKLLSNEIFDYFKDKRNYVTHDHIRLFSRTHNIHPAVVVGILAHNEIVSFANLHRFNDKVRYKIPSKYLVEANL